MSAPRAWLLNLDAERELVGGARIDAFAVVEQRPALRALLEASLVPKGDVVMSRQGQLPRGAVGYAWCPTPGARTHFTQRGARCLPSPSIDVLRAVNHRAFLDPLALGLEGGLTARSLDEAKAWLARGGPTDRWLLKHPLGFAGRSRRTSTGALGEEGERFVARCLEEAESVRVEPLVDRLEDLALHGFVRRDGAASFGGPTRLLVTDGGSYRGSERVAHAPSALFEAAERVAEALSAAGYFGPFGVDAFHYRASSGEVRFHPLSEINARYTMGWAIGFGEERPDLAEDAFMPHP